MNPSAPTITSFSSNLGKKKAACRGRQLWNFSLLRVGAFGSASPSTEILLLGTPIVNASQKQGDDMTEKEPLNASFAVTLIVRVRPL